MPTLPSAAIDAARAAFEQAAQDLRRPEPWPAAIEAYLKAAGFKEERQVVWDTTTDEARVYEEARWTSPWERVEA